MDKQNENHSASKNPILSSLLDSQKVNDNRKRSNQEEHEEESEEYVTTNMNATLHYNTTPLIFSLMSVVSVALLLRTSL